MKNLDDVKVLLFDLETQLLAQELPSGWEDPVSLRVSILSMARINWKNNCCDAFYTDILRESEIQDFFAAAAISDVMIGWGASYYSQILEAYDDTDIMGNRPMVDLKCLTHKYANDRTISTWYLAEALGVRKMGKTGTEAVDLYRKGHFYELSRFSVWDLNILSLYWMKIMRAVPGSGLLVLNGDKKQVKICLHEIKEEIIKAISKKSNRHIID